MNSGGVLCIVLWCVVYSAVVCRGWCGGVSCKVWWCAVSIVYRDGVS